MDFQIPDDWRYMRVKEELDNGRLWKARDRLLGKLADQPANQDLLGLLGDVYFAMGDLPQAGRYWWLTDRDDDRADAAAKAFYERFGTRELDVLRALPRPTIADAYSASVRARYEALMTAARDSGQYWKPPGKHRPADYVDIDTVYPDTPGGWRDRLMSAEFLAFVLVLMLVFAAYGLVTFVSALLSMKPG
jgi:hypothetical protein